LFLLYLTCDIAEQKVSLRKRVVQSREQEPPDVTRVKVRTTAVLTELALSLPIEIAIAQNRFGLGAGGEDVPTDPKSSLLAQLHAYQSTPPTLSGLADSTTLGRTFTTRMAEAGRIEDKAEQTAARGQVRQWAREVCRNEIDARVRVALSSPAPFIERLVHFWSNHFAVSVQKPQVYLMAGAFEREVVRPHVLGRFEDMLLAAERHAAMLIYLDQGQSSGPNSQAATRAASRGGRGRFGINENLAREIMELHTLGVRSGYEQADVTEFALALTGFGIGTVKQSDAGYFLFRPGRHEPGERRILGKTYAQEGEQQALAVLRDLATAEATAMHIATKLARHFIADDPPTAAVERLAGAFREARGDLSAVYEALIASPEAWQPAPAKFKTPWEWTISALRGLGMDHIEKPPAPRLLTQLGQPVWQPGSPAGYDDIAGSWAAPGALLRRVEAARLLAARAGDVDPRLLAQRLFAGTLSEATQTEVANAESVRTGVALLLVSPDFQRR